MIINLCEASGPTPGLEVEAAFRQLPKPTSPYAVEPTLDVIRSVARPSMAAAMPTLLDDSQVPSQPRNETSKVARPLKLDDRIRRLTAPTPSKAPGLSDNKPVNRSLHLDLEEVMSSPEDGPGQSSLVFPEGHSPSARASLVNMTPVAAAPSTPIAQKERVLDNVHATCGFDFKVSATVLFW